MPGKYFDANNGKHALVVRAGYNVFDNSNAYNTIDNHLLNQAPFATNIANSVQVPTTAPLAIATGFAASATPSFNSLRGEPELPKSRRPNLEFLAGKPVHRWTYLAAFLHRHEGFAIWTYIPRRIF